MTAAHDLHARIAAAVADRTVVDAVHLATWRKVDARAASFAALPHAETLRDHASRIRDHTLAHLPHYLRQFADHARAAGARVHFAPDARTACELACEVARLASARLAVKAKSMTTEEVELNAALLAAGVRVVETDLGEFIVQLDHDTPSHIITPIIHKNRQQVGRAMARELGTPYTDDPQTLTRQAREYLRRLFRTCDLGITGANFAIAESGTLVLLTNEGNGRMTTTRPRVHIALVGIEKLLPRLRDLGVLLKLIARSSTGQPLGSYTTLLTGPRRTNDRDGPDAMHIIFVDNGRSGLLHGPDAEVLKCIRCGACLNACPAYRNVGGHAYASVYPGPIGSLVSPLLQGAAHAELPRVSSLCGLCAEVCPVKIDIPAQLVRLRARWRDTQPWHKRLLLAGWAWAMQRPAVYRFGQRALREFLPDDGGWATRGIGPLAAWTRVRDLQRPAPQSFRTLWQEKWRHEE